MAYSVKYLFKFESSNGTTREIRVLQDGYTGEVIQRPLGRAPVLKKQQNGPVHGTSLEFYAECNVDREFIEFYTSDPKAYRVDLYAGAVLLWRGYITPELYSEPDIAPPYDVQVVATDGVGELKLYDYAAQGTVTLRALLSGLLARTGLGTDIYLISSLKAGSRGAGALLDMTINLDYMAGESCYDVLTYLLDTLHATITWWKGAWILTRETNVTFTSGKVRYFNTAGNSALLNDSVQVLGKMYANPAWPVGQLSTVIDPAKNRVTVQAPWHVVTCLRNSDMGSDSDWTKAKNARYETDGYVLPVNINTGTSETAVISQATSMAGLRVPMSLSVKATGATSEISAQVVGAVLGVLLTYKVGNVTYHLVKGDDGVPVWQQGGDIGTYIPLRTRIDFQQQLATWDSSRIEAEELTIDNIPPFLQGTTFPAGTLTVYILGYCAKIYGAYLDVVLPKGYQDILHIDNGARGEGSEVEIAIGRETADNAYYAAFLQGLLLDSGSLITSFSDANFPGGMDYLAFIARDYALSVALPRAKVTGTVYLESGIAAPPLVFTKGALNYWLQTWSWNLYEDELEIEGLTLPSASLTVESETILESNGSTVSSAGGAGSSSAGSPMGGGVGTNYWEIDGTLNTLLKPKDAYAYVHSKGGLFFTGAALSGTVVPDLYVDTVNNQRVLRSPLPLITGGDQIVIDGTPGGGGGGGGATTLAGLDDTNITNPQAGQMLSWNGSKWVNTNAPTGSITSVSLAAGATNGTLHLVVNGTAQSDVAVTGLGSLAYKSSLAASDIPDLSATYQPKDADLTAIAGLSGTSGFLKKTAANTWSLDTNTYLTGITSTMVTNALGYTPANSTALADYVKLTSAGQQVISVTGATDTPVVFKSGLENASWIGFRDSANTILGYIGMTSTDGPAVYVGGAKKIWHAGNLTLASLAGNTAKGSTSLPIYYTGSALAPITDLDLLSQSTGYVKANRVYLTSSIYFYTETVGGTVCVRLNAPFITAGDQIVISGTPGGGGGGGATTLAGLDDVAITSVANGQLLQYNGSKWVNVAASSVGGVTSVAGYTGAVTAAQISSAIGLSDYLPLSAGSSKPLTNDLYITGGNGRVVLGGVVQYNYSNTMKLLGPASGFSGDLGWYDGANWYKVYHAGNFVAGTNYVAPQTTLTGYGITDALKIKSLDNSDVLLSNKVFSAGTTNKGDFSAQTECPTKYGAYISIQYDTSKNQGFQIYGDTNPATNGNTGIYYRARLAGDANTTYKAWRRVLDEANYSSYALPIAGGQINGTTASPLTINTTASNNYLYFATGGTSRGNIGYYSATIGMVFQCGDSYINIADGGELKKNNAYTFWHSGNYTTWINTTNFPGLNKTGTVTSVAMTVPTGLSVSGTPITDSGILTISFESGYSIPTTAKQSNWDTAYGWGNHASAGYLLATTAASTYVKKSGDTMTGPLSISHTYANNAHLRYIDMRVQAGGGGWSDSILSIHDAAESSKAELGWAGNNEAPSRLYLGLSGGSYLNIYSGNIQFGSNDIYHQGNANLSTVAWECSTLTASGNASCASLSVGSNMSVTGTGTTITGGSGSSNSRAVEVTQVSAMNWPISMLVLTPNLPANGTHAFMIGRTNASGNSGSLSFRYVGNASAANSFSLGFHSNDFVINAFYSGNVTIGTGNTTDYGQKLYVAGNILSTGDQVVSSDRTLKENLTPVTYSVSDIAKARAVEFDWKDGRGHSMGSIAQDWLGIAPALVHGEEGNMSLAYGQLALVNTILLARQSESHEERIKELEARVAELEMENERLRMN